MILGNAAKRFAMAALVSVSAFSFATAASAATMFDAGMPAGWTAVGSAGVMGANGAVTAPPVAGATQYGYVSTSGGVAGAGTLAGIGNQVGGATTTASNGSTLTSTAFAAAAGQNLQFFFNYVTSDGSGYADYAWAQLLDATTNAVVATLFTARTTPGGNTVPGFGMPAIAATVTPGTVTVTPGVTGVTTNAATTWAALGAVSSGACFATGCGNTGWVQADYVIAAAGSYLLKFGVTNFTDTSFDSGLAFAGITIGGTQITQAAVPVPGALALLGIGLAGLMVQARRRQFN